MRTRLFALHWRNTPGLSRCMLTPPSGSVSSAVVTAGDYDGATRSCIQNRFKGAKVSAFGGDPVPVGWSITL